MEPFKLDVLTTLYKQQQSTAHILRERMSKITASTIGTLVVIDGWLIASGQQVTELQTVMLILSVVIIVGVAVYGVYSRYKEFSAVARLIVRIEMAMKIYEQGVYIESESLYPEAFKGLGTKKYEHGKSIFLSQLYVLLIFGALSVSLGVLA